MTSEWNERSATSLRLDSWKAIACHFGRSCRTVQRWYSNYGLPVRRLGDNKGPVFAYVTEVDDWMRNHGRFLETRPTKSSGLTLLQPPAVRPEPDRHNPFENSLIPEAAKERSAELVILGYRMWEALSHRNLSTITRLFREAIDLNPRNAAALAGLSQSLVAEVFCWMLSPSYAFATAQTALREALEIDHAMMPEVISAEGWIKLAVKRDWQGACSDFDIVLNRHPRFMSALMGRAMLHIANGSLREASAHLSKIFRWNALNSIAPALHCWCQYLIGDYPSAMLQIEQARASGQTGHILDTVEALASLQFEESHAQIERIESLAADSPGVDLLQGALGYAYAIAGKRERSVQILDAMTKSLALRKNFDPYGIALVLIGIDRRREAVELLVQSYREGSLWSLGFQSDPILAQLETDEPHFRQLLSNFPHHIGEPISQLDVTPRIHAGSHHSRI